MSVSLRDVPRPGNAGVDEILRAPQRVDFVIERLGEKRQRTLL